MLRKIFLLYTLLTFTFIIVLAQKNNPMAGQDSMVLENERIFDIKDSDKPLMGFPNREIQTPDVTEIQYLSKDYFFDSKPELPPINPIAYNPNSDSSLKNANGNLRHNYIKAGLGQFITPYAELYLTNSPKSAVNWVINAKHSSSHLDKITLRQFREESLLAQIGKTGKSNVWDLTLRGFNNAYSIYAHTDSIAKPSISLKDSLGRGFTNGDIAFHIGNERFTAREGWVYEIKVGAKNVWDSKVFKKLQSNNEYNIFLLPKLQYYFNNDWSAGFVTDFVTSFGKISDLANTRFFVNALPYVQFENEKWKARAGASINNFHNTLGKADTNQFFIASVIEASYQIIPSTLSLYAGYKGGMKNNTYYDLLNTCRYVSRNVILSTTTEKMHAYLGAHGNIMSKLDLDIKGYYKKIANPLLFYGTQEGQFIQVMYDSLTSNWGSHIEVNYSVVQTLHIGGAIDYNHFKTTTAKAYFGTAPFQARLYSRIQLLDSQVSLQPELYIYGKTPMGLDKNNQVLYRGFMPDLSIKADYRITERFSAFLHLNNLIGVKYYPYLNFPERRWNFLAGVGFIF